MLDRLNAAKPRKPGAIRALILTPTRELALQIGESFAAYGKYQKLRATVIFGGVGQAPQVEAIKKGVEILDRLPGPVERPGGAGAGGPLRTLKSLCWTKPTGCWTWALSTT